MRIVFAGTPEPAVASLQALLGSRHEVAAVITRPDARTGRGRTLTRSPVAQVAAEAGIVTFKPENAADPDFLNELTAIDPDACPVVAYGALLRPAALAIPRFGWINLHFSLLPAWRGAAPVQHAIWHGDDITGATTFRLDEGMDTGPVFGTVTEAIGPRTTSGDLLTTLSEVGAHLLVATLDAIESGEAAPVDQPADGVSYAPKITTDDARINWGNPALAVDRQIRAVTPAPGAWTLLGEDRIRVASAQLRPDVDHLKPGELLVGKRDVVVGTATHGIELTLVRPPGKREMPAADWARGARLESGTVVQ
jgi:methionyl-tRNA formyltransferase